MFSSPLKALAGSKHCGELFGNSFRDPFLVEQNEKFCKLRVSHGTMKEGGTLQSLGKTPEFDGTIQLGLTSLNGKVLTVSRLHIYMVPH
jgi:hypothetical protein